MGLDWLTDPERAYFTRILSTVLKNDPASKELPNLLRRSGLPLQVTRDILRLVEKLQPRERVMTALKYVGLAQAGKLLKAGSLGMKTNLPRFDGVPYPQTDTTDTATSHFPAVDPPPAVRGSDNGRTKYLDEAFQDSPSKSQVMLKPLQSKFVPNEDDIPSPTELEEEKAPSSAYDTDLIDFAESAPAPPKKYPSDTYSQSDLLSDYFIPATKNSLARGTSKAFVFPSDQPSDSKPPSKQPQGGIALTNRLPSFPTRDLPHRGQTASDRPLTAKDILENEGELGKLKGRLIQFMRLEEAEKCQEHIELIAKIRQVSLQKKEALQRDVTDDAYEHQKIIVNLKEKLATEKDVSKWMQPIPESRLDSLYKRLTNSVGVSSVRLLKTEFQLESLQPDKDIHSSMLLLQEACAVAETWIVVGEGHDGYLEVCQKVLQTCKEEMQRAARLLPKLRQNLQLAAQDSNYDVYIRAIPVVHQLTERVSLSTRHLSKLHPSYLPLLPLIDSLSSLWKQCEPHLTVKPESEGKNHPQARCGVCLRKGAELPHEGGMYHPPCINWWVIKVEEKPPTVKLIE